MFGSGDVMLRVLLRGKDELSDDLRKASKSTDTLGDEAKRSEGLLEKMGKTGVRAAGLIGSAMKGAGRVISVALKAAVGSVVAGGIAGGLFGKWAVEGAAAAEEISSKFDAVFKDLSGGVRLWAAEQSRAVNRSRIDFEQYLSQLQDTFVPLGFARNKAAELSKQLATLGVDLASFNNAAEGETIDLLTSAIVGNHEAVRRFGIIITESTLKLELQRMGVAKNVQAATEMEKVQARLNIIMRSTSDAQGDAARTANSLTNAWRGFQATLRDWRVDVGNMLTPIVGDWLGKLTAVVKHGGKAVVEAFRPVIMELTDNWRQWLDGLYARLKDPTAIKEFAEGLKNAFIRAYNRGVDFVTWVRNDLIPALGEAAKFGIELGINIAKGLNKASERMASLQVQLANFIFNVVKNAESLVSIGMIERKDWQAARMNAYQGQFRSRYNEIVTRGTSDVMARGMDTLNLEMQGVIDETISRVQSIIPELDYLTGQPGYQSTAMIPGLGPGGMERMQRLTGGPPAGLARPEHAAYMGGGLPKVPGFPGTWLQPGSTMTIRFESPERGVLRQGQLVGG